MNSLEDDVMKKLAEHPLYKRLVSSVPAGDRDKIESILKQFVGQLGVTLRAAAKSEPAE